MLNKTKERLKALTLMWEKKPKSFTVVSLLALFTVIFSISSYYSYINKDEPEITSLKFQVELKDKYGNLVETKDVLISFTHPANKALNQRMTGILKNITAQTIQDEYLTGLQANVDSSKSQIQKSVSKLIHTFNDISSEDYTVQGVLVSI